MASIQKRGGIYNAHFKVWDASKNKWKWTAKSTRTDDPHKAHRIANELQELALKAHEEPNNTWLHKHALRTVNSILQISGRVLLPSAPNLTTFADYFVTLRAEKGLSPSTEANYRSHLGTFCEAFGASTRLDEIKHSDVLAWYQATCAARTVATANSILRTVRSMYDQAQREGHIPNNPAAAVLVAKAAKLEREPFTRNEVSLILAHCEATGNQDAHWLALCGLCLGARISDCAAFRSDDFTVTPAGGLLCTWAPAKTKGSTGRKVTLPVLEPLLSFARAQLLARDPVPGFVRPSLPGIPAHRLSTIFTDVCEACGIEGSALEAHEGAGKRWRRKSHHSLRHTMNNWLKAAGADREHRKDVLGQASDSANEIYSNPQIEKLSAFMEKALSE